jgi:hypothetical protein
MRSLCTDVAFDPGRASAPRVAVPLRYLSLCRLYTENVRNTCPRMVANNRAFWTATTRQLAGKIGHVLGAHAVRY